MSMDVGELREAYLYRWARMHGYQNAHDAPVAHRLVAELEAVDVAQECLSRPELRSYRAADAVDWLLRMGLFESEGFDDDDGYEDDEDDGVAQHLVARPPCGSRHRIYPRRADASHVRLEHGKRSPFGWQRVDGSLDPKPREIRVLLVMAEMRDSDDTFAEIARNLNSRGKEYGPRTMGSQWGHWTVSKRLTTAERVLRRLRPAPHRGGTRWGWVQDQLREIRDSGFRRRR